MSCALCATRKPRRFCPAAPGDICTACCAESREVRFDCPVSCEHLRQAHQHERTEPAAQAEVPNADIRVDDEFLQANEWLFVAFILSIAPVARRRGEMIDLDAREALECLIRTSRTSESGLIDDTKPGRPGALELFTAIQERLADIRKRITEADIAQTLKESTVLGMLVFLQRLELARNNGRPRSKAFLESLCRFAPEESALVTES